MLCDKNKNALGGLALAQPPRFFDYSRSRLCSSALSKADVLRCAGMACIIGPGVFAKSTRYLASRSGSRRLGSNL